MSLPVAGPDARQRPVTPAEKEAMEAELDALDREDRAMARRRVKRRAFVFFPR